MSQDELFLRDTLLLGRVCGKRISVLGQINGKVDQRITDKSAYNFIASINSGDLYQELRFKDACSQKNSTES